MKIINFFGKEDLAKVYIADFGDDRIAEFVESLQPPIPRSEKWVLIISTSFGCSVKCIMCDAGAGFKGRCSTDQMFEQLDYLVSKRYPDFKVPAKKFKVQFARMGEPAFNNDVLETIEMLKARYKAPGLMPCVSTIAPANAGSFFDRLCEIKDDQYSEGNFQLQFSLHSTDETERDRLMPTHKWSLSQIAKYGERFFNQGDRKITLNFALVQGMTLDPNIMQRIFTPERFMIKFTPVNPTYNAVKNKLQSHISSTDMDKHYQVVDELHNQGFHTLISIGENEENLIGSNCGQFVMRHISETNKLQNSYTYIDTLR